MSRPTDTTRTGLMADSITPLAPHEFDEIRQLARRTFGLDLRPGKEDLVAARLRKLLRSGGFRTFQEYYRHVREDRSGEALTRMVDALTTNHTSFMREAEHFEFLRKQVLPEFAARDSLEIWSAACATGEEVWTLAFVLDEVMPSRKTHIIGSDISNQALRTAQRAAYPAERLQGLAGGWKSRYFLEEAAGQYRVCSRIRSMATFRRVNLIESFSWPSRFPVIFCRNVMIYFDRDVQERVVERVSECLEPGGFLFVGHAESLTRIRHSLDYVRPAIYRKPGKAGAKWIK